MSHIKNKVNTVLWSTTKFLVGDTQIFVAANKVHGLLVAAGQVEPGDGAKRGWMKKYARAVNFYLIKRRDYFFTRIKVQAELYHDKHGVWLTPQQILACATRKTEEMEVFKFYWTNLLPVAAGGKLWENQKYYNLPSTMIHEEISGGKTKLFPGSHEAMIVLAFDNNEHRWPLQHKIKAAGGVDEDHPEYKESRNGKYTKQDLGQRKTGWSEEGLKTFNDYQKQVKEARSMPHYIEKEKEALKELREEKNIVCNDGLTQKKLNKRRKLRGNFDDFEAIVQNTAVVATAAEDSDVEV